ncbi:MAG: enoyl-CoA hydratase/isomerase family protein [Planctomycetes bacterium]|nr:enoyl-CoA hydratase/isomerase family protein [Planctomycetota bacterium]
MQTTNIDGLVRIEPQDDGLFWRIVLTRPPNNAIDRDMIVALTHAFERAREEPELRATVLIGEGDNFSTGASPESFLPDEARRSVPAFLDLIRLILDTPVFRIAVLRGECMGRGLELARICNRVYAEPDARVGLPEIKMGVLPPVASILLPERIGRGPAGELCATGYIKDAREASWMALVDHAVDDAENFAISEVRAFLRGVSAASLRNALQAIDLGFRERILDGLARVQTLYENNVLTCSDAIEGVEAAIEGREPRWKHA